MKKLLFCFFGSILFICTNTAKAEWDKIGYSENMVLVQEIYNTPGDPSSGVASDRFAAVFKIYTYNSKTGEENLISTHQPGSEADINVENDWKLYGIDTSKSKFNEDNGTLELKVNGVNKIHRYDINANQWSTDDYVAPSSPSKSFTTEFDVPDVLKRSDGSIALSHFNSLLLKKNSDESVQVGSDNNDIDITAEGLNIDGNPLITKKNNGEIHIGKNSLITKSEEETLSDGRKVQPLYAKDADGNKIPINIDGSKLLIDGEEVTTNGSIAQVTTNKNNISTNTSNISTNTSNISTNTFNISTNTSNISTNTSNISTNTSNISTNTSNISTNTSNISTNTSNIKSLGQGVAGSTALTAALTALPQTSKESKLSCGIGSGAYSSRYAVGFGCASKVNERVDMNAGGSYVFGGSKSYGGGTLDNGVIKAGFVFKLGELNKTTQISMKDKKVMETKIKSLEEKNKKLLARLERIEKFALRELNSKDLAIHKLQ